MFNRREVHATAVAHNCPLLETIDISYCERVTDIGVSTIAYNCYSLENINLSHCDKITDAGVSAIAYYCSFLRNIDLAECRSVTFAGISALVHCFLIRVSDCIRIPNDFLYVRNHYPLLRVLID